MSYLREAVTKQKSLLINKLIHAGVYRPTDEHIYSKTITELVQECQNLQEAKVK